MPVKRRKVIFILGPTAIGKTALAFKLALKIKGEVISCDSMQIYKGMKVLSQAPGSQYTKRIPHHLVNFFDPRKEFSVAQFIRLAGKKIKDIIRRGRVPIVVGGTGLYFKSLVDGLFPSPGSDIKFRKNMQLMAGRYGNKYIHDKLKKIDHQSALSIHPNDIRRVIRALEIYHCTGNTMTELKARTKGISDIYDIRAFGLTAPRDFIYCNIDKRIDQMFAGGALREAKKLYKRKLGKTAKAVIGLNELANFLRGYDNLQTATGLMKKNTRNFAKRQLTWFKADKRIRWFDVSKLKEETIIDLINKEAV